MAVIVVEPTAINAGNEDRNLIAQLVKMANDVGEQLNTLTAKMDLDAGITDTDYAATLGEFDTLEYSTGSQHTPTK